MASKKSKEWLIPMLLYNNEQQEFTLSEQSLQKSFENPEITKFPSTPLPVAIIAVLGKDNNQRLSITNSVANYLDQKLTKTVIANQSTYPSEDHFQSNGIYLYPQQYIIQSEPPNILLLLHANSTKPSLLVQFLALSASKLILYDDEGQSFFKKSVEIHKDCGIVFDKSSALNISSSIRNGVIVRPDVLSSITNVNVKLTFTREILTLTNLNDFLTDVYNYLIAYYKSVDKKLAITGNDDTATDVQTLPAQLESKMAIAPTSKSDEPAPPLRPAKPTRQITQSTTQVSTCSYLHPCNDLHCTKVHIIFSKKISDWLQLQTINFDLAPLHHIKAQVNPIDHHRIFAHYIDLIFQGLEQFHNELRNKFDNYLCYSSDKETLLLKKSAEEAYHRTSQIFTHSQNSKSNPRISKIVDIYFSCCNKMFQLYDSHNQKIVQAEKSLADKVFIQVTTNYKFLITKEVGQQKLNSNLHEKQLDTFNARLTNHCMAVVRRSLDYSGRLNTELGVRTKDFLNSLQNIYKEVKLENGLVSSITETNTERAQVHKFLQEYIQLFVEVPTTKTVSQRHQEILNHITGTITNELLKQEVILRLNAHFTSYMDILQEKEESCKSNAHSICIYFSDNFVQMRTLHDHQPKIIRISANKDEPKEPFVSPLVAFIAPGGISIGRHAENHIHKIKKSLHSFGFINDFITRSSKETVVTQMLTVLLQALKFEATEATGKDCSKVLIFVPAWFHSFHRLDLRNFSKTAGFSQIKFLSESAAAAFSALNQPEVAQNDALLAVVVCKSMAGICVSIYRKRQNTNGGLVQLVAISASPDFDNFSFLPQAHVWESKLKTVLYNTKEITAKVSVPLEVQNLTKIFNTAFDQLSHKTQSQSSLKFIYFSDDPSYDPVFMQFISSRVQNFFIGQDIVLDAGTKLLANFDKIRDFVSEDALYLEKEPHQNSHKKSPENAPKVANEPENPEDGSLEQRKKLLLAKCHIIKSQLANGQVKIIGNLMKTMVNEAVEKALEAASHAYSTTEQVEFEEKEMSELISQHKIQLQ